MTTEMQITKSYPPAVEELRQQWLTLMDYFQSEATAQVKAIHPLLPDKERNQELQRIERQLQTALWPCVEELSRLENYASVSILMAA